MIMRARLSNWRNGKIRKRKIVRHAKDRLAWVASFLSFFFFFGTVRSSINFSECSRIYVRRPREIGIIIHQVETSSEHASVLRPQVRVDEAREASAERRKKGGLCTSLSLGADSRSGNFVCERVRQRDSNRWIIYIIYTHIYCGSDQEKELTDKCYKVYINIYEAEYIVVCWKKERESRVARRREERKTMLTCVCYFFFIYFFFCYFPVQSSYAGRTWRKLGFSASIRFDRWRSSPLKLSTSVERVLRERQTISPVNLL